MPLLSVAAAQNTVADKADSAHGYVYAVALRVFCSRDRVRPWCAGMACSRSAGLVTERGRSEGAQTGVQATGVVPVDPSEG